MCIGTDLSGGITGVVFFNQFYVEFFSWETSYFIEVGFIFFHDILLGFFFGPCSSLSLYFIYIDNDNSKFKCFHYVKSKCYGLVFICYFKVNCSYVCNL